MLELVNLPVSWPSQPEGTTAGQRAGAESLAPEAIAGHQHAATPCLVWLRAPFPARRRTFSQQTADGESLASPVLVRTLGLWDLGLALMTSVNLMTS